MKQSGRQGATVRTVVVDMTVRYKLYKRANGISARIRISDSIPMVGVRSDVVP